jgi:hypothetical protein
VKALGAYSGLVLSRSSGGSTMLIQLPAVCSHYIVITLGLNSYFASRNDAQYKNSKN